MLTILLLKRLSATCPFLFSFASLPIAVNHSKSYAALIDYEGNEKFHKFTFPTYK